jgi:trigger factor
MQSEVENLSGLTRKLTVTVPQEQIQVEINKRINELAKKAVIKGFRKGKVPTSVVKLQFGDAVKQEVIQDILWESLQQACKDNNVFPVGQPKIEVKNFQDTAPFEYEASFEVYPEVKLDLEGISVEQPVSQVEDQNVTDVIEKLRKQNVKWVDVDRAAQKNDMVNIDFEGFLNDEPFEGGTAKGINIELGSGQMIPGFEDALYGAKKDDDVLINVSFPEDYHVANLAGKPVKFKTTVHKVSAPELPELNDAFAKDLGVSAGSIEGLREEVGANLKRELEKRMRDHVKEQVIDAVLEKNRIEVPQALIDNEITRLQQQMQKQWAMQTGQKKVPTLPKEHFQEQARKNVVLGLLLTKWIEDNELKVDGSKVRQRVEEIASGYHQPEDIVNWYYSNKEGLAEIEAVVIEEQAMDKILEQVKVTDKPVSFDEIMNPQHTKGKK